jgi:hypothetical protein
MSRSVEISTLQLQSALDALRVVVERMHAPGAEPHGHQTTKGHFRTDVEERLALEVLVCNIARRQRSASRMRLSSRTPRNARQFSPNWNRSASSAWGEMAT